VESSQQQFSERHLASGRIPG